MSITQKTGCVAKTMADEEARVVPEFSYAWIEVVTPSSPQTTVLHAGMPSEKWVTQDTRFAFAPGTFWTGILPITFRFRPTDKMNAVGMVLICTNELSFNSKNAELRGALFKENSLEALDPFSCISSWCTDLVVVAHDEKPRGISETPCEAEHLAWIEGILFGHLADEYGFLGSLEEHQSVVLRYPMCCTSYELKLEISCGRITLRCEPPGTNWTHESFDREFRLHRSIESPWDTDGRLSKIEQAEQSIYSKPEGGEKR
jgi:hypothetical protein